VAVPSAWPALLALAVVVLLSIGMLATDLIVEHRTAAETTKLVGDALRSVTLADHLRADAHALAATPDPAVAANVAEEIARDAALYEPLATYPGEHAEWTHLQGLLEGLQREQMNGGSGLDSVVSDIEASIDRIVQLNEREAADSVTIIRAVHRQAFAADAIAGAVTLVLAIIVATVLVRALRRQRFLIEARLETEQARRRELDAFAARVAHDLRGPLTPIRSYGELLCLGSGPPPREIGARIVDGTRRMVGIIDGLLTLSVSGRVGVGQTEIAPVIHQALDDLGPLPADSKIALAIADCRLCCPPDVLGRIVENLVSNAIKYRAPERPLELAITAARVKRTVDALGGACSIASKPGEGTRVTIRLPAAL